MDDNGADKWLVRIIVITSIIAFCVFAWVLGYWFAEVLQGISELK